MAQAWLTGRWGIEALTRSRTQADVQAMGDRGLLQRAAWGDEASCKELLARYGARLLSVVRATHGDLALDDDIVQETFIRAIRQGAQLKKEASLFPWLVRIALRVAIDHRRSRRRETLTDVWPENTEAPGPGPDEHVAASQDAARVKQALAQMKPYHRELLVLRYFTSFSAAELAEVFHKSDVAIRKDLQRAREAMRKHLEPWFTEE
ncbi:MAG: sigma-70 family RNA polymerase sigma factor [Myxococcota bacterium]